MMCGSPRLGMTTLRHSTAIHREKISKQETKIKQISHAKFFFAFSFLPSFLLPMDPLKATASWFLALSDISIVVAMADGEGRKDLPGQCLLLSRLVGRSSDSRNYTTAFYSSRYLYRHTAINRGMIGPSLIIPIPPLYLRRRASGQAVTRIHGMPCRNVHLTPSHRTPPPSHFSPLPYKSHERFVFCRTNVQYDTLPVVP